jgi:3-deoxy-manno-octulosonate cytidylyltransferase (CMP-KDO synthetase)
MKAVGIIPARLHSTRFPRKILYPINDKPMVVHVYEQAKKASQLEDVLVAIDSDETEKALKPYAVNTIMTSADHASGSDRVAEVAGKLEAEVIVNIQGDEPGIDPGTINALVDIFNDPDILMATAASTRLSPQEFLDPNAVKVLLDKDGYAVNFCRVPRGVAWGGYYLHIGIYAYRKEVLLRFTQLPESKNEVTFKLEQWRALDNGIPIKVILTDRKFKGIDRMEDVRIFQGAQ